VRSTAAVIAACFLLASTLTTAGCARATDDSNSANEAVAPAASAEPSKQASPDQESGTSLADVVVGELAPQPGELMFSEGADDLGRVQDRLANMSMMQDPKYAYRATEPQIDQATGEVKVGMVFTDNSTLYLVSVPLKNDKSMREFVRYEIER
jgi:hypothetical protein